MPIAATVANNSVVLVITSSQSFRLTYGDIPCGIFG
jgi:hypothetical protein